MLELAAPPGLIRALVTNNDDPLARGRIRVRAPMVLGSSESGWVEPSAEGAEAPNLGAIVYVFFDGGDFSRAVWLSGGQKGAKGDKGDTGAVNTLAIGNVTTTSPGSPAYAEIYGPAPNQLLDLVLPRGATGPTGNTGPANVLTPNAPTTLAPGATPTVNIGGTAPNQTLTLGIPRGSIWTTAVGTPSGGLDGDQHLHGGTGDVYTRAGGNWGVTGNIRGPQGATPVARDRGGVAPESGSR